MTSTNRNATLKRLVDVASAIFLITPFICGVWLFLLFHSSKSGFLSIASTPTIFGWLPAPLEIIFVDFIPFTAGQLWILYRCAPALYPFITNWKFMIPVVLGVPSLIILVRILYYARILDHTQY